MRQIGTIKHEFVLYAIYEIDGTYFITIDGNRYKINAFIDIDENIAEHQLCAFIESIQQATHKTPTKKYYVEFTNKDDAHEYIIQSKWHDTQKQAEDWLVTQFDFVATDRFKIYIMCGTFDSASCIDITTEKQLTANDILEIYRRNSL